MEIAKEYRPEEVEARWLDAWDEAKIFQADPTSNKQPFCMVIPPPNVTGNLHIGHVLVYTLHDVVARWRRMQGRDVLWLPGTDHAGIATQMVVERELAKTGESRGAMGREAFEQRVWQWKETYGGRILKSLRELGSSVDWSRERFTLDPMLSRAVREVFVRLYEEGLIYRGRYMVNWDPVSQTAVSDLEVEHQQVQGKLYTIRYPAADGSGKQIQVATTRPETMLGDTGVAVHPDDPRYKTLVGVEVEVPLTGRRVPVVADDFVDPEFGTGAVKITPAHDPNDFAAGERLGLPQLQVIDEQGNMNESAGEYAGLERFEARKKVVADLEAGGFLVEVKTHQHAVGHSQRSGAVIEPLVSNQWFVKIQPLADPAIQAVERGDVRFVPETWSKVYFEWMRNIHDWCISRQLWWGHRIPAWYCADCDGMTVVREEPTACVHCGSDKLRQDQDVLDTWFSSGLFPFSSMGWPDDTVDLQRYYPTSLLITGHDIIFFWVARMIMSGLKFADDVPFDTVYIHGLVRDEKGQKMSKTKGNTVDPEVVRDQYGTDAVRFTMAILAAPGNDIPLAPERMEGYRAFANKLWNAFRFVRMKLGDAAPDSIDGRALSLADRWILSRAQATLLEVNAAMEAYRFDHAADRLYHFVWGQFCDWYIELVKPDFYSDDPERVRTAQAVLADVLRRLLRMLHPFMPFITEELWHLLPGSSGFIAVAPWPADEPEWSDASAEQVVERMQEVVVKIRNLRAETHIPAGKPITVQLSGEASLREALAVERARIASLVRADSIEFLEALPDGGVSARGVAGGMEIAIPLEGLLDLDAERKRIEKELKKLDGELAGRAKKLQNQGFLAKAPAEVVEKEKRLQVEQTEKRQQLADALSRLAGA